MRHARPYLNGDVASSTPQLVGHANGVVSKYFVTTNVNECRRQP